MKLGKISAASVLFLSTALPAFAAPAPVPQSGQAPRIVLAQATAPAAAPAGDAGAAPGDMGQSAAPAPAKPAKPHKAKKAHKPAAGSSTAQKPAGTTAETPDAAAEAPKPHKTKSAKAHKPAAGSSTAQPATGTTTQPEAPATGGTLNQ